jgi:dipeptidyl aminopeptidase/acylaminoacyl peptidase
VKITDSEIMALPYGLWKSDEPIESVFRQPTPPMYPFRAEGKLCWLESRPRENGRIALMRENPGSEPECITPQPFNIRTAVHEYGGRCFCVIDKFIVFNNYSDGKLYCQLIRPGSMPQLLIGSPESDVCVGFADLVFVHSVNILIAVAEATEAGAENNNSIVSIFLDRDSDQKQISGTPPVVLAEGSDFYANPVVSADGIRIAWFEWSHPNMPWDQSRLVNADLIVNNAEVSVHDPQVLIDKDNQSVCQLGFLHDASLVFARDGDAYDHWNLFIYNEGEITRLTDCSMDFGEAHWVFGQRRWIEVSDGKIIAVTTDKEGDAIVSVDRETGNCNILQQGYSACSHVESAGTDEVLLVTHYSEKAPEISSLSIHSGKIQTLSRNLQFNTEQVNNPDCSKPVSISFPTGDGEVAYGYFYPPYNPAYSAPENDLPPLLIVIHGGPTSRATSEYSGIKQYFCSLGFALLDVNHRGSTGFGRKFRQSLLGNWGEFDADDIACAIEFVVNKKWVDRKLVFIRGSSAGGYAVLRALTRFPSIFAAGACYYGIGNLITLSKLTHKFEAKYTDRLVGECFNPDTAELPQSRFVTRSPVFQIDNLSCPLILFQGCDDKVVPPKLSREVVNLLEKKGLKYSYIEYPGEGHGFRKIQTRIDSLEKETAFYSEIIKQSKPVRENT